MKNNNTGVYTINALLPPIKPNNKKRKIKIIYFLFFLDRYKEKIYEITNNGKIVDKLPAWIDIIPIPPDSEIPKIKYLIITAGIWRRTIILRVNITLSKLKLILRVDQKNKKGGKTLRKNKKNSIPDVSL